MGRGEGVFVSTTRYTGLDSGTAARLHVCMRPLSNKCELEFVDRNICYGVESDSLWHSKLSQLTVNSGPGL